MENKGVENALFQIYNEGKKTFFDPKVFRQEGDFIGISWLMVLFSFTEGLRGCQWVFLNTKSYSTQEIIRFVFDCRLGYGEKFSASYFLDIRA